MKRTFALFLLLFILFPVQSWAAVAFDNVSVRDATTGTTITGTAFTISGSNRAAIIGMIFISATTVTGITCDIGGTAGAIITGTDSGSDATYQSVMCGVVNPPTGSQSATVSWTSGSTTIVMGAISFTGANQGGVNSGTFNGGTTQTIAFGGPTALSISSNSGDLSSSVCVDGLNTVVTNQTLKWGSTTNQGGDIGPGTAGPISHTWGSGASHFVMSGANVVQTSAGPNTSYFRRRIQ